jgi:hypothetical protein
LDELFQNSSQLKCSAGAYAYRGHICVQQNARVRTHERHAFCSTARPPDGDPVDVEPRRDAVDIDQQRPHAAKSWDFPSIAGFRQGSQTGS